LHGWWNWGFRPWFWGGGGGWWGYPTDAYAYYNPYYIGAPNYYAETNVYPALNVYSAPIDYSQPLPVPETQAAAAVDPLADQATAIFNEGRDAFRRRDYQTALARVDEAIRYLPSDAALHEFRALTLFALQRYSEAAATIYAVLAVGPGWSWETVRDLYLDPNDYTDQLRALEAYIGGHRSEPASRFLLAYHYLVMGDQQAAANQLLEVTRLSPEDKVSAELYKSLTTTTN